MVTYYLWTSNMSSGFEKFIDSQSFGTRFLWTTIGVLIAICWKRLDQNKLHDLPTVAMTVWHQC